MLKRSPLASGARLGYNRGRFTERRRLAGPIMMHNGTGGKVREELARYGARRVAAGLTAGSGGNLSARDGGRVWLSPSGLALDELGADDFVAIDIADGLPAADGARPTSEFRMHLGVYRQRPDVNAVFHTHPPVLTGIVSSGAGFRPLVTEVVFYLGRVVALPYLVPTSGELAAATEAAAREADTILLPHHGLIATGATPREAFHRSVVAEHAARAIEAAANVGKPRYLTEPEIAALRALTAGAVDNASRKESAG